jgi:hypothetical protein
MSPVVSKVNAPEPSSLRVVCGFAVRPARFCLRTTRSRIRGSPDEPERRGWHPAPNVEHGAQVGRSSTKRPDAKAKSHSVRQTKAPPARRSSVRTPFSCRTPAAAPATRMPCAHGVSRTATTRGGRGRRRRLGRGARARAPARGHARRTLHMSAGRIRASVPQGVDDAPRSHARRRGAGVDVARASVLAVAGPDRPPTPPGQTRGRSPRPGVDGTSCSVI